jgi:cell division protease FtsH
VFGETSTGAEADIRQVTELARQMVGSWGMSPAVGPIAVIPQDGAGPFASPSEVSPETQRIVDGEVRRIVEEAHLQVASLLEENRNKLDALADALLERETLDQEDAYRIAGVSPHADQTHVAAAGASPRRG